MKKGAATVLSALFAAAALAQATNSPARPRLEPISALETAHAASIATVEEISPLTNAVPTFVARAEYAKLIERLNLKDELPQIPVEKLADLGIVDILSVAEQKGLDVMALVDTMRLAIEKGLDAASLVDVLRLAIDTGVQPSVAVEIMALVSADVTEAILVQVASISIANGLTPTQVAEILRVAYLEKRRFSRFDILHPAAFTTLWEIKRRGKLAEENGENTDELWRQYWDIFAADAVSR